MAGSAVFRLPRPLSEHVSRSICWRCGSATTSTPRLGIPRSYATAREREWAKRMDRYYSDILHSPKKPDTESGSSTGENYKYASFPMSERDKTIEKARVVFGSRLAGPKERRRELDENSTRIAGVLVPPRPDEPDNCCMSGCVNCVWDRYRDELEEWAEKSALAREAQRKQKAAEHGSEKTKLRKTTSSQNEPVNVLSMDDDGGGSETLWTGTDADNIPGLGGKNKDDDLFAGIPIGIREFMKTEKRLREQKKQDKGTNQKYKNVAL